MSALPLSRRPAGNTDEDDEDVADVGEDDEDVDEDGEDEGGAEEGGDEGGEGEHEGRDLSRIIVQVLTLHCIPNFLRPWETGHDVDSSSTAFVVSRARRLLMTTAGAVEYSKRVEVCRDGIDYDASVVAVSADCDVALLTVKDRAFWSGMTDLEFGPMPQLQAPVTALGYPLGGESAAVTSGVVSRIEVLEYTHSGRGLLALQVDAAINSGSWGAPLLDSRDRCVGMAFQKYSSQTWMERYDESMGAGFSDTDGDEDEGQDRSSSGDGGGYGPDDDDDSVENVAYCVPALILQRVLSDFLANGKALAGLPMLGMRWQRAESAAMRRALGLAEGEQGVRVTGVDPGGSCAGVLLPGDLLISIDGRKVSSDGSAELAPGQRVLFGHFANVAPPGTAMEVGLVRGSARLTEVLKLRCADALVPTSLGARRPEYVIVAGLVFAPFSVPFVYDFNPPQPSRRRRLLPHWSSSHIHLQGAMDWGLAELEGEQVVTLLGLLPGSKAADGYSSDLGRAPRRLESLNGVRVLDMEQLARAVVAATASAAAAAHGDSGPAGSGGSGGSGSSGARRRARRPAGASVGVGGGSGSGSGGDSPAGGGLGAGTAVAGVLASEFLRFGFSDGSVVVLRASDVRGDTIGVLADQSISHAMSADLRRRVPGASRWPAEAGSSAGEGEGRQARQQKRRLAVRR